MSVWLARLSVDRWRRALAPEARTAADSAPTALVADAKSAGLAVHAWTVRPENDFLPPALRTGDDPKGKGCGDVTLAAMLKAAGVAGVFSDGSLKGRTCP